VTRAFDVSAQLDDLHDSFQNLTRIVFNS